MHDKEEFLMGLAPRPGGDQRARVGLEQDQAQGAEYAGGRGLEHGGMRRDRGVRTLGAG